MMVKARCANLVLRVFNVKAKSVEKYLLATLLMAAMLRANVGLS